MRLGTFMDDSDALGPVVTRAEDRERESSISFSNGATDARKHMEYHPLAQQKAGRHMEPFIIDINPETTPEYKLSAHEGEEFIYVMEGEVEVEYGKEKYSLKEGDSIYYDSIVKHHLHGAPGKCQIEHILLKQDRRVIRCMSAHSDSGSNTGLRQPQTKNTSSTATVTSALLGVSSMSV